MHIEAAANNLAQADHRFNEIKKKYPDLASIELTEMYRSLPDRAVFAGIWQNRKVVVKLLFQIQAKQNTQAVYAMQSDVFDIMVNSPNRIPEILYHLPEEGVFIFEFLDGQAFDTLLLRANHQQAQILYKQAGSWLRDFTHPSHNSSKVFKHKLLQRAKGYIDRTTDPETTTLAYQLHTCLKVLANRIGPSEVHRAITHGDFYPRNLIQTADAIYGIDLENTGRMFVFDDIARFLLGASGMTARTHSLKYGIDEAFLYAFLSGYAIPLTDDTLNTLRFFIAKATLDHLCTRNEALKRQPQFTQMAQHFIATYGVV